MLIQRLKLSYGPSLIDRNDCLFETEFRLFRQYNTVCTQSVSVMVAESEIWQHSHSLSRLISKEYIVTPNLFNHSLNLVRSMRKQFSVSQALLHSRFLRDKFTSPMINRFWILTYHFPRLFASKGCRTQTFLLFYQK